MFSASQGFVDLPVTLPCGQCIGCRLEHARQWAVRCMHEASMHERNCFITLTYRDECLPADRSVSVRELQLFFKRLRKAYSAERLRYYACGEYGAALGRPHYHACVFGFDFPDKYIWQVEDNYVLYRSPSLEKCWPFGFSTVGDVSFESAGYVARYCLKKVTGKGAAEHYQWADVAPEFSLMSRRPGLGRGWFERFKSDVYPKDFFTVNGRKNKPPRYYDMLLEGIDPRLLMQLKVRRQVRALENQDSGSRLLGREKAKNRQIKALVRRIEV